LLVLFAGCASNGGFVDNNVQNCGAESEVAIEAGWDQQTMREDPSNTRMTMLVRVSNNSHEDIVVKAVHADPMAMDADSMYEIERGSITVDQPIAEGDQSTFEIPMMRRWQMQNRPGGIRASGIDVAVNVVLASEQSYRCRFRMPL
jgi:hypothetical protein